MKLYSIFDKQTATYNAPFAQPTHGAAERAVKGEVNNQESMLGKYSSDYELWFVGWFEESTGELYVPEQEKKTMLCNLQQLKERPNA